jgi:p-hydroxybenzoate 3-monooxygenase
LLHHFPNEDAFAVRVREAELEYLFDSPLAQRVFAENYVGLPIRPRSDSGSRP